MKELRFMNEPRELHSLIQEWISLADDDLESARDLARDCHWRQACILSQQAVEKYVKAMLTQRQIPPHRTHDIEKLASLLTDAETLGLLRPDVLDLSEYAVDPRYPGTDAGVLDSQDSARALKAVAQVSEAIHKALGL